MHKMWNFSTLQRPTQEEKERRRRYREEQLIRERQSESSFYPKVKKLGRAKTFRHSAGNILSQNEEMTDINDNEYDRKFDHMLLQSLPGHVQGSFVDALRQRAKSASRVTEDIYSQSRKREQSVGGFVSRLRFLDSEAPQPTSPTKLRWHDRENGGNSSGYSSGGRQETEFTSDDTGQGIDDLYAMTTTMQRKKNLLMKSKQKR